MPTQSAFRKSVSEIVMTVLCAADVNNTKAERAPAENPLVKWRLVISSSGHDYNLCKNYAIFIKMFIYNDLTRP
jgi:hypothetical protein